MKLKAITDAVQHGIDLLKGEETLDKVYQSQRPHSDESSARSTLAQARQRLFAIERWSEVSSITADFFLYDSAGNPKPTGPLVVGDYIKIVLPGPPLENWVTIIRVSDEANVAEFVAQPSANPHDKTGPTEHFFTDESTSTFRVELQGTTVRASQSGKNERANNQEQAGNRAILNTVVAGSGWLFYQKIQWQTLTDYIVGL